MAEEIIKLFKHGFLMEQISEILDADIDFVLTVLQENDLVKRNDYGARYHE